MNMPSKQNQTMEGEDPSSQLADRYIYRVAIYILRDSRLQFDLNSEQAALFCLLLLYPEHIGSKLLFLNTLFSSSLSH